MTVDQIGAAAQRLAGQMVAAGVDMDLAPVLDIDGGVGPNRQNADGLRSWSPDPQSPPETASRSSPGCAAGAWSRSSSTFPTRRRHRQHRQRTGVDPAPLHLAGPRAAPVHRRHRSGGARRNGRQRDRARSHHGSGHALSGRHPGPAARDSRVRWPGHDRQPLGRRGRRRGYDVAGAAVAAITSGADMVLFGSTLTRRIPNCSVPPASPPPRPASSPTWWPPRAAGRSRWTPRRRRRRRPARQGHPACAG